MDRQWLMDQIMFHFGQVAGMAHKEGTTRDEIVELGEALVDKIIAKVDEHERTPPG